VRKQQKEVPNQKVLEMVQNRMQNPKVLGTTLEMTRSLKKKTLNQGLVTVK